MAYQLAQLLVTISVENSAVAQAVAEARDQLAALRGEAGKANVNLGVNGAADTAQSIQMSAEEARKLQDALKAGTEPAGKLKEQTTALQKQMDAGAQAGRGLFSTLTEISGLKFDNILALGGLGAIVSQIGALTKQFFGMTDTMAILPLRLKQAGIEGEGVIGKVRRLTNEFASTGLASREEMMKSIELAATRGPEKTRGAWEETIRSAAALKARFGGTMEEMTKFLGKVQQNYQFGERMLRNYGISIRRGATKTEVENALKKAVAQGEEIMKAQEMTFQAMFGRLSNALAVMRGAFAQAIGPAVAPMVKAISSLFQDLAERITNFVNANREQVTAWVQIAVGIGAAIGSIFAFKAGLLAVGAIAPQIAGMFSPLTSVFTGLAGSLMNISKFMLSGFISPIKMAIQLIPVLSNVIKVALIGTGVGAIAVIVGSILAATGVFDDLAGKLKSVMDFMKANAGGVFAWFKAAWKTVQIEAQVVFAAIKQSGEGFIAFFKKIGGDLLGKIFGGENWKQSLANATAWLNEKIQWLKGVLSGVWDQIAQEAGVLHLRFEQFLLLPKILVENFHNLANFIGELLSNLWDWLFRTITTNFPVINDLIRLVIDSALAYAVKAGEIVFKSYSDSVGGTGQVAITSISGIAGIAYQFGGDFFKWLSNQSSEMVKSFSSDWKVGILNLIQWVTGKLIPAIEIFRTILKGGGGKAAEEAKKQLEENTKKELDKEEKAREAMKKFRVESLKIPELNLSGRAKEEFDKIQKQIEAEKAKLKAEQDALRGKLRQEMDATAKKASEERKKAEMPPLGRPITGTFSDLMGSWKKIQEVVTDMKGESPEALAKKQIAEQKETNQKLGEAVNELKKANEAEPPGPGMPIPP